jgi:SAM-dependent methyltransferase
MESGDVPSDWYRNSFSPNLSAVFWEEDVGEKVDLALGMLEGTGRERILDLACATGRRALELSRREFDVIGVEVRGDLLEIAGGEAELEGLTPYFYEVDPREMDFRCEFDWVLSLGGGAFGYFDYDEGNLAAFQAAALALRPGGKLLMQVPNIHHVEAHLPSRTWISTDHTLELIEQCWNAGTQRIEGKTMSLVLDGLGDFENDGCAPFERRLYTVEELAEIFEEVGLSLVDVYDEDGERCAPTDVQQEIFVEARA